MVVTAGPKMIFAIVSLIEARGEEVGGMRYGHHLLRYDGVSPVDCHVTPVDIERFIAPRVGSNLYDATFGWTRKLPLPSGLEINDSAGNDLID